MSDTVTISRTLFDKLVRATRLREPALEIDRSAGQVSTITLTKAEYNELLDA